MGPFTHIFKGAIIEVKASENYDGRCNLQFLQSFPKIILELKLFSAVIEKIT